MAHKLDFSKGTAAFTAAGAPAWHGLGKIYTDQTGLTTEQALTDGGLNYEVLKMPNVHVMPAIAPATGMIEVISEDSFFTFRTDTNNVLGSKLGKNYEVLQNIEALNVVDEMLQSGTVTIETAGAIDEGRKVFICLKIVKPIIVGSSDIVEQFILICTSHDGTLSITALPTNVRVVCNNTLTAALQGSKGAIKIRHTASAAARLTEAAKVLNLIKQNTEVNTENYNKMKELQITKEQMFAYFGNIFCTPEEIKEMQKGNKAQQVLSTQKQNILAEVGVFAQRGTGQELTLNNGQPTAWTAYNAVTGYIARKNYSSLSDRANSMLFGTAAATIETAGILALEPAKIQPLHKVNFGGLNLN